ncbi:hypothetical protein AWZ03_004218 [Drosophila navojoa]|uniref:Uncharacterized protein n=1 Tax=Drosophila navojoa TaxID=7232 RepID=A0A484BMT0_DRONA|nr:hypothetical protein AWZ03_004218 [Drosophila navojoa]
MATMCTTNKNKNCYQNTNNSSNRSNYCSNNSGKESSCSPVLWVALVGFALALNLPGCLGEQHPATADEGQPSNRAPLTAVAVVIDAIHS